MLPTIGFRAVTKSLLSIGNTPQLCSGELSVDLEPSVGGGESANSACADATPCIYLTLTIGQSREASSRKPPWKLCRPALDGKCSLRPSSLTALARDIKPVRIIEPGLDLMPSSNTPVSRFGIDQSSSRDCGASAHEIVRQCQCRLCAAKSNHPSPKWKPVRRPAAQPANAVSHFFGYSRNHG